ncbi:hypothetical protein [Dyella choica]|uniref:Uncharacterized protein n=1 Tax=Dyella choica TaxID=1927959 RepID=A0A432MA39_9GAMM|nr:hypothetical protein [Dyella choica]RUL79045.1 hypothetical protein EKH80_04400 [Dyella choica]
MASSAFQTKIFIEYEIYGVIQRFADANIIGAKWHPIFHYMVSPSKITAPAFDDIRLTKTHFDVLAFCHSGRKLPGEGGIITSYPASQSNGRARSIKLEQSHPFIDQP